MARFAGLLPLFAARCRVPENRGVPGSNPGLAIERLRCKAAVFGKRSVPRLLGEGWGWVTAGVGGEEFAEVGV